MKRARSRAVLALTSAALFLITGCAQQAAEVTSHVPTTPNDQEHDIVETSQVVTEFYPDHYNPHELVMRQKDQVGMVHLSCAQAGDIMPCSPIKMKILGSPVMQDGEYNILKTDDLHLWLVRDAENAQTTGYILVNDYSVAGYYSTLEEAKAAETRGDGWKTAGKILLYTALILLVVGVVAMAAYGGAQAASQPQTVTTTCTSWSGWYRVHTTCVSR